MARDMAAAKSSQELSEYIGQVRSVSRTATSKGLRPTRRLVSGRDVKTTPGMGFGTRPGIAISSTLGT
jgi:hypothetical protein